MFERAVDFIQKPRNDAGGISSNDFVVDVEFAYRVDHLGHEHVDVGFFDESAEVHDERDGDGENEEETERWNRVEMSN